MQEFQQWHQTRVGLLIVGLVELGFTYVFASLAIDRGDLIYYLIGSMFLIGMLQNFAKLIWKIFHEDKAAKA